MINWPDLADLMIMGLWETVYMVGLSNILAYIVGLPLGVVLVVTDSDHILPRPGLNRVLGVLVNATRSLPFIILLIFIIPLTRLLLGTFIGTTATIVPLTVAAIPFVARLVETSLKEIEWGVIEAALSMGAGPWQIIYKVLIPESLSSLVLGFTITTINLVGYSAMAGVVGGGGLGAIAYQYGFQRYRDDIMWATVIILILLVQGMQSLGEWAASRINKN